MPDLPGPSSRPDRADRRPGHQLFGSEGAHERLDTSMRSLLQLVPEERVSQRVHEGLCLLSAAAAWPPSMFS